MKDKVLSLEGQLKISEDKCSQLQDQVIEVKRDVSVVLKIKSIIISRKPILLMSSEFTTQLKHAFPSCFPPCSQPNHLEFNASFFPFYGQGFL